MSDSLETPWSDNPNAPQIPSSLYLAEKETFAGALIGAMSYGIVVAMFFQCTGVLLSPTNPIQRGMKWALVVHTVAMFLFVTIPIGIYLGGLSVVYVDNRGFPGGSKYPPGPIGYTYIIGTEATITVLNVMLPLNQWLADSLLLHRCYVIYSRNCWVMAFPCLVYLASVAMGVADVYQGSGTRVYAVVSYNFNTSYYSISLSLNVLLTLMAATRLIVYTRNIRKAAGAPYGSVGLNTTAAAVAMILIESYALYAVALLLYMVPWAISSRVSALFASALGSIRVIAPYLITLRVASRRAVTSESISGTTELICFGSREAADGDGWLPDGYSINSTEVNTDATRELAAGDENATKQTPM